MTQDSDSPVQIGHVIESKYRIDRILGIGGMGIVAAATHLQLDQLVALKFIRREAMVNHDVVSRFEREARAAVRLRSEHVARIIDVGRLDSAVPYIVMEYLEGQDLAALLAQGGALAIAVAVDYVVQACDAIAEAHGLGIIHRDLKPGNLFLATTSHGRQLIKVLDFGISKTQTIGDPSMTRTQMIMGSPGYMSPEQMRSAKNVDGRSDIWSLGIILYELVSGRVPFHADTFTELCVKVATEPPPQLPTLPNSIPRGFEAIIQRALAKDPLHRYPSAAELARALSAYGTAQTRERAQRLATAPVVAPVVAQPGAIQAPAPSTLQRAAGPVRAGPPPDHGSLRRRAIAVAALCCAVVAVGFAVTRGAGGSIDDAHPPAASRRPEPPPPAVVDPPPADPVPAPPAPRAPDAIPSVPTSASAGSAVPVDAGVKPRPERMDIRRRPVVKETRPDPRPQDRDGSAELRIDPYGSPD